ncbi:stage II sporulation protein M [Crocosphaera sp.]|uniref:stage II sporulation protein M n=1 Tax=Crocosphaera sp. TaxID=2729996 RepID=UPI003F205584|nr:stage II sporulation protein M [Crocosphaera sp.]
MKIQRWIARREPAWQRLDFLLKKIEKKGIKSLNASEIQELSALYRSVSADLARAKTFEVGNTLTQDLHQLTTRAYSQIYQGPRGQDWGAIWRFYRWGFPETVQQTWPCTAIATFTFLLGGLIAWWYAWSDPAFIPSVVPPELITKVRDEQELWMGSIIGIEPLASSGIMINNMSVSFRIIGGGIIAGIFTLFILFYNGLLIGSIATLVGQNNLAYPFWAFVFPHGSLELPAIFLSGGAGLLIAKALLFPGNYTRVDAFKIYGLQAAQLVFGVVPLLFIAGIIEGFFSPNPSVPDPLKYVVGLLLFIVLIQYCSVRKQHQ